jgi:hypothetical protein
MVHGFSLGVTAVATNPPDVQWHTPHLLAMPDPVQASVATISSYGSSLARNDRHIIPGSSGTFWAEYESFAMMRIPDFCLTPPSPAEVERVLWKGRIAVATYLRQPGVSYPANAWLYVCRDKSYKLEKLNVAARRDARRANRSMEFGFVEWPVVLSHGFTAYSDSRQRVGLSDGTREHFQSRIQRFSSNPSHTAVGAWKDGLLVAFMALIVVDDWVAIEGSFSDNDHRTLCPNDGLANFVLRHFLMERGFETVTYGLSSVQELDQSGGLHTYKKKVGFEAIPVHRAFTLHPLLKPFANHITLASLKILKRLVPGNRLVKKAGGMLASLLEKRTNGGNLDWRSQ